jgi:EAL domain-containing protein (putative c-di-GMP-specific phosphodiesterase class I)
MRGSSVPPPGAFLPSVERYNLSVRYDRWVIAAAGRRARAAMTRVGFYQPVQDSVVIGNRFFRRQALSARAWISAHRIRISENVAIANLSSANQLVTTCAASGASRARRFRQRRVFVRVREGALGHT